MPSRRPGGGGRRVSAYHRLIAAARFLHRTALRSLWSPQSEPNFGLQFCALLTTLIVLLGFLCWSYTFDRISGNSLPSSSGLRSSSRGQMLKLLFLTLEYKAGTFSGNGVYAQSMVRSLAKLGHSVLVISAAPPPTWQGAVSGGGVDVETGGLIEIHVPVWGTLARNCGWREYADGITNEVAERVAAFKPDWALVVDWSAVGAYRRLTNWWEERELQMDVPTMAYLNYRVYTITEYKGREDQSGDAEFYRIAESAAVGMASAVMGLNSGDAKLLEVELGDARRPEVIPRALLPALREDIRVLADKMEHPNWAADRKYFTCCVRLSEEKNAMLFADVIAWLGAWLRSADITPLLCGGALAALPGSYAAEVRQKVTAGASGALVLEGFMGPDRLAEVYSSTLLNLHPCTYDAYGMTIVEAAAFAAPSILHRGAGGSVGASELLPPNEGLSIGINLTAPVAEVAEAVKRALLDRQQLAKVGLAAREKALAWSEEANAKQLVQNLLDAPRLLPWP